VQASRAPRLVARLVCLAVVAGSAVHWVRALVARGPTDFDDAYMFLRYAHNLLAGHGLAWNPGEAPVFGATSLLHVAWVALLRAALPTVPDGSLLPLASALPAAAAVGVLAATCARRARHPWLRDGWLWAAALSAWLAGSDAFLFHTWTGMDTTLALLANAVLCAAALRLDGPRSTRAVVAAALAGALAVLARPDGALFATLTPLLAAGLLAPPPRRRALLALAAALAGLLLLDVLAKRALLGTALPLAFHAKRPGAYGGFAGEYAWNPFLFLRVFLTAAAPAVAALLVFAGRASARPLLVLLAPVVPTFAALFWFNQIMGHLGRFFFPALPFLVVAAALALDGWLLEARPSPPGGEPTPGRPSRLGQRALAAAAAMALVHVGLGRAGRAYEARAGTQRLASLVGGFTVAAATPLPELDSWRAAEHMAAFAAAAPPGTRLAMSEHGLPGARAPAAIIIDVLGLHDREMALAGFSPARLFARAPDVIWMPHPDHTQMVRDLLDSDELWAEYDVFPDAFCFGVALRRDSPRFAVLWPAFQRRWAAAYPGVAIEGHRARRAPPPGSDTLSP
jgi:hypothetical protein